MNKIMYLCTNFNFISQSGDHNFKQVIVGRREKIYLNKIK